MALEALGILLSPFVSVQLWRLCRRVDGCLRELTITLCLGPPRWAGYGERRAEHLVQSQPLLLLLGHLPPAASTLETMYRTLNQSGSGVGSGKPESLLPCCSRVATDRSVHGRDLGLQAQSFQGGGLQLSCDYS